MKNKNAESCCVGAKNLSLLLCIAIAYLFAMSCTKFPTQFGYIDPAKTQTLAVDISPFSEGAPGDTLHLSAYFAGDSAKTYTCSLSTKYIQTVYGSDSSFGFVAVNDPAASLYGNSLRLSFVIPADFFANNAGISKLVRQVIPESVLPASATSAQIIAFADNYLRTTNFALVPDSVQKAAMILAEKLTGKIAIHLTVNSGYTITRTISVRYNSKIRNNRYAEVNHNPFPFWLGVYKVKKTTDRFSPPLLTQNDTLLCMYIRQGYDTSMFSGMNCRLTDTILVDTGFLYYAAADSGWITYTSPAGQRTLAISLDRALYATTDSIGVEGYNYTWFYNVDSVQGIDPQRSIIISNDSRQYYEELLPPLDDRVKNVTLYLNMYDSFTGDVNRPTGTSLFSFNCVFTYTPAYVQSAK